MTSAIRGTPGDSVGARSGARVARGEGGAGVALACVGGDGLRVGLGAGEGGAAGQDFQ